MINFGMGSELRRKLRGVWMKPASYEDLTRILGRGRRDD